MCRLFSAAHRGHARYRRDLTPRSSHQEEGITKKARPAYLRTGPTVSEGERQGSGHAPPRVLPLPLPAAFTAADTAKAGTCRRAGSGPLCRRCLHHRGQRTKPCEKAKSKAAGKTPQGGDSQGEALGGTEPFPRDRTIPEGPGLPSERHLGHQHWSLLLLLSLPRPIPNSSWWLHGITKATATATTRVTCCL